VALTKNDYYAIFAACIFEKHNARKGKSVATITPIGLWNPDVLNGIHALPELFIVDMEGMGEPSDFEE